MMLVPTEFAYWLLFCISTGFFVAAFPSFPLLFREAAMIGIFMHLGGVILCLLQSGWVYILLIAARLIQIITLFIGKKDYLSVCIDYNLKSVGTSAQMSRAGAATLCHLVWVVFLIIAFISFIADIGPLLLYILDNPRFPNEISHRINPRQDIESSPLPRPELTLPFNFAIHGRHTRREDPVQPQIELFALTDRDPPSAAQTSDL